MSNPLEPQHVDDGDKFVDAPDLPGAATEGVGGPAASNAAQLTRPAGTSTSQPVAASSSGSISLAMDLLQRTVTNLERQGSTTYAAGVASRMRQTDSTFNVQNYGFKTFKAFLEQAAAAGIVHVSRAPGASDLTVTSVGPTVSTDDASSRDGRYLRHDLWSASTRVDGSPTWWRYDDGQLIGPVKNAPQDSASWIELLPLTRNELVAWMRAFIEMVGDPDKAAGLSAAVATPSGPQAFIAEVRAHQGSARKWGRFYREHVMQRAFSWAEDNSVPREALLQPAANEHHASVAPEAKAQTPHAASRDDADYEKRVRAAIASAVEQMPLAELLRLRISAEYLIGR